MTKHYHRLIDKEFEDKKKELTEWEEDSYFLELTKEQKFFQDVGFEEGYKQALSQRNKEIDISKEQCSKSFFALGNPLRMKIYEMCLKEKLNITTIANRLSISYRSALNNLRILEDGGFIKREEVRTKKAKEIFISSDPLLMNNLIDILNTIKWEAYKIWRDSLMEATKKNE